MLDLPGRSLDKYQIIKELGRGGLAIVYRAHDPQLERDVALKVLRPLWNEEQSSADRFCSEVRAAAELRHPNIVTVHDVGEIDGQLYVAMEYLPGHTLRQWLRDAGALPLKRALSVLEQLASALDYAHGQGVVHLDLKPGNVMLQETSYGLQATLVDFGLVKAVQGGAALTSPDALPGSPEYMAPEQADPGRAAEVGSASDRYALGAVAYHMLTGRAPFVRDTPATLDAHLYQPPPDPQSIRPSLLPGVSQVLLKALSKAPADRFDSAGEFVAGLSQILQARQQEARLSPFYQQLQAAMKKKDWARALELGGQIQAIDPDYRDVPHLVQSAGQHTSYPGGEPHPLVYVPRTSSARSAQETPVPQLHTEAVKLTHPGRVHDHNEDCVEIKIPGLAAMRTKGTLYLVADGAGGQYVGELASQQAIETVIAEYYSDSDDLDVAASLKRAVQKANSLIHAMAQNNQQFSGMETTLTAVVVRGAEVHVANVGHSRAYLLRGGQLIQITIDHSFVQEQINAGVITPAQARNHPRRGATTRALGRQAQVEVDTFSGGLASEEMLLLCSDGLSGVLRDAEMAEILRQEQPSQAITRLVETTNQRGGPDNISALLIQAYLPHPARPPAVQVQPGTRPMGAIELQSHTVNWRRRTIILGLLGALLAVMAVVAILWALNVI
jgi:serine/threonine protein phosphatase PrpC